jgi:hypothetical protein
MEGSMGGGGGDMDSGVNSVQLIGERGFIEIDKSIVHVLAKGDLMSLASEAEGLESWRRTRPR